MTDIEIINKMVNISEKEDILEEDMIFLIEQSTNEDAEIRNFVAELLVDFTNDESKKVLLTLSEDDSWIVRASAYDSLSVFNDEKIISHLKSRIKREKSAIAKSYAIMAIGDILKKQNSKSMENICFLKALEAEEKSKSVKMSYYYALYLSGDKSYIDKIIKDMDNASYQRRCACINMLKNLANKENKEKIIQAMKKRLEKEKVQAVLSLIKNFLNEENEYAGG